MTTIVAHLRLTPRQPPGYSRHVLFEERLRQGLHDGSITLAFRRWRRPQVVAGHQYRPRLDMVCAEAIDEVTPAEITPAQAREAGYPDVAALLASLRGDPKLPLYRIRFRRLEEPDPRDVLAATATLTDTEIAAIAARLARMDAASSRGPWTAAILAQIASKPAVSSEFLAEAIGWERGVFKVHVRRLKALGLTISLDVGYRLSPRGQAYLAHTCLSRRADATDLDPPRPRA
jgi:biotin operon repressor